MSKKEIQNGGVFDSIIDTTNSHLAELGLLTTAEAVILYGSHASQQAIPISDLDILIVSDAPAFSRPIQNGMLLLDLTRDSYDGFHQRMSRDVLRNNNFILNALSSGIVVHAKDGRAIELLESARSLYRAGPKAITRQAAHSSLIALQRLGQSSGRLVSCAYTKESDAIFARMRCDRFIIESIYLHCKINQWWTSAFPVTVASLESKSPFVYQLWKAYCASMSIEDQYSVAREISTFVLDELEGIT